MNAVEMDTVEMDAVEMARILVHSGYSTTPEEIEDILKSIFSIAKKVGYEHIGQMFRRCGIPVLDKHLNELHVPFAMALTKESGFSVTEETFIEYVASLRDNISIVERWFDHIADENNERIERGDETIVYTFRQLREYKAAK